MDSKDRVRARVLADRAAMAPEELRLAGTAIARRVLDVWDAVPATGGRGPAAARVASYLAAGSEPATRKLIDALRERGVDVVVPVVLAGGVLDWARYEGPAATTPNRFGIDEPTGARLGTDAVATADMVVVPGLAVDTSGRRLGRGGGYYDRALERIGPGIPRVLVVYDSEVFDAVPHEPHDQRVDVVVTPTRTLHLGLGRTPDATSWCLG